MEIGKDVETSRTVYSGVKEQEAQQEQGEECTLDLHLPDGSHASHSFKVGVTVAYVKLAIQEAHHVPMASMVLKINGKQLLDPLSLLDCPGIKPGAKAAVEVTA